MNVIPDVVICCVSDDLIKSCGTISKKLSKEEKKAIKEYQKNKENWQLSLFGEELDDAEEDFLNRDFRRALKARAMHYRLPIRLGTDRLFVDSVRVVKIRHQEHGILV